MQTTRLSSKGQLIIPKAVREAHGWSEGTQFVIEECDDGLLLKPAPSFPKTTVEELLGCTGYEGPALSIEDMDTAIADEARQHR